MNSSTATIADSPEGEALNRRVLAAQLTMMCRYSRTSLVLGVSISFLFCWLTLQDHSFTAVGAWFIALVAVSMARVVLQQRYCQQADQVDPKRWAVAIKSALVVYGLIWSIPSTFMIPTQPSTQVVLGVVSVGLAATALGSLAPLKHAYACFLIPYLLPITIFYVTLGGDFVYMAVGVFAFLLSMLGVAHRNTRGTEELMRLQFDHAALATRLRKENEIVERANRDLEAQVAQRERTEAELRVAKAEAESANRAKSQFLANMSHELRTPLNGVLGMSDLLIRSLSSLGPLTKPLKHAQIIRNSGERLLHLIDDILDMARIEAGAMRFDNRVFDPRRMIAETAESLSSELARKNLALNISIASNVPDEVLGDASRLRQVLTNLVANAIKFTEKGKIEIGLVATPLTSETTPHWIKLRFSVADTGIGIADHSRQQLFRPFSQVDESPTRRFGGTGLGLAICNQIVTALGGRIDVDSTPGKGSIFWFEVPIEVAQQHLADSQLPTATSPRSLQGRVLVAEDNGTNCDLIVEMLELAGCHAVTATNGVEALEKLTQDKFDAVLMDWHMPQLDGLAATRAWREREHTQSLGEHLPVIALTASVLPGDREACMQAGMDDFIPKPFTYDELVNVLQRWIPHHGK